MIWRGRPALQNIGTSYVERHNGTIRQQIRRFTRRTLAFSKCLRNLRAAVSLYVAWYDFCRTHGSLKMTPAMALGIADTFLAGRPTDSVKLAHCPAVIAGYLEIRRRTEDGPADSAGPHIHRRESSASYLPSRHISPSGAAPSAWMRQTSSMASVLQNETKGPM